MPGNNDTEYLQGHGQSDFDSIAGLDASDNLIGSTEGGNLVKFDDQPFLCSKFDDYLPEDTDHWTRCKAHSLGGEDEVLVIESGNPTWISAGGYGPQALASGDTVTSVDPDPDSRPGVNWSPATLGDWKNAKDRSSWGTELSPYQERACQYKSHVVRRELVHGSYEEHVEGDMYTTIEGTWISKIKGNVWDTFYGYCHEDFNEHFEEIFYSTKAEVQMGDIVEYNHGKSYEYYYGDVENEFKADVKNTYGEVGAHTNVMDTYYGVKTQHCYGAEHNMNLAEKIDFYLGPLKMDVCFGNALTVAMLMTTTAQLGLTTDLWGGLKIDLAMGGKISKTNVIDFNDGDLDLHKSAALIFTAGAWVVM